MPGDPIEKTVFDAFVAAFEAINGAPAGDYHFNDYLVREFQGVEPGHKPMIEVALITDNPSEIEAGFGGGSAYHINAVFGVRVWVIGEDTQTKIAKAKADVKKALEASAAIDAIVHITDYLGSTTTQEDALDIGKARVDMSFGLRYFEGIENPEEQGVSA